MLETKETYLKQLLEGLNPEQTQVVEADRSASMKVLAGAGTGKTKLLAHRFVKLVQDLQKEEFNPADEHVLAITFTVKAAGEMKERINQLLKEVGYGPLSEDSWVGNFHGICHRILQHQGSKMGLKENYAILNPLEKELITQQMIDRLRNQEFTDIGEILAQSGLGEHVPANIFSLDFLASNELLPLFEECLIRLPKILDKIKSAGYSPLSFYKMVRQQTLNATEFLKALPTHNSDSMELYQSHEAYCHCWEEYLTPWAAQTQGFLVGTPAQQNRYYQTQREKAGNSGKIYEPKIGEREDYFKSQVDWIYKEKVDGTPLYIDYKSNRKEGFKSGCLDFSELDALTERELKMADFIAAGYVLYQDILKAHNACDFDDLILYTIRLLEENPDIQQQYQNQFQAILVDEFQDSNGSQLKLLELLKRPENPALMVVGDEKQSIYGFRYAQPENLDIVFRGIEHQSTCLMTNYRSRFSILEASNHFTQSFLPGSENGQLKTGSSHPEIEDPVQWLTVGELIEEEDEKGNLKRTFEPIGELKTREIHWVVAEIKRLINSGQYEAGDIAVLTKNHNKAETIFQALKEKNIVAERQKVQGFFEKPIIKDCLAMLYLLEDPQNDMALVRLMEKKLSQKQLRNLAQLHKQLGQYSLGQTIEILKDYSDIPEGLPIQGLSSLVESIHSARKEKGILQQFQALIQRVGLVAHSDSEAYQKEILTDVRTLMQLLVQMLNQETLTLSLAEIIEALENFQGSPELDSPLESTHETGEKPNAVEILTVHAAKGLEWRVVFLAYTEDDRKSRVDDAQWIFEPQYPGKPGFGLFVGKINGTDSLKKKMYDRLWRKPREDQEARRLFYVALTRAKERLYVLRALQSSEWTDLEQSDCNKAATLMIKKEIL